MTPYLDLLTRVRDHIANEPDSHDQNVWMTVSGPIVPVGRVEGGVTLSCPTAACVAGWACFLNGDSPFLDAEVAEFCEDDPSVEVELVLADGEVRCVESRAQELLGLEDDDALDLFDAVNTRDYVLQRLDVFIEREKNRLEKVVT